MLTQNANLAPVVVASYGSAGLGQMVLAGGYRLSWTSRPAFSAGPHLATDIEMTGADTRITGTLRLGLGGVALHGLSGRAGPGLARLLPGGAECSVTASLDDVALRWGWRHVTASGALATPAGTCQIAGQALTLPPLTLALATERGDAVLVLRAADPDPLATLRIRRDRYLNVDIAPAAADVFPQLPRGGPISLQLPF